MPEPICTQCTRTAPGAFMEQGASAPDAPSPFREGAQGARLQPTKEIP
jgi:hypothetical protein